MRTAGVTLPPAELPATAARLRDEVRGFLADERAGSAFDPRCDAWLAGHSPEFSRKLGARGWLGMTWPARYGGGERTSQERFVVIEELLAAGAPVAAHWIADRQVGPAILKFGTEWQRSEFLPRIAAGECYFALGMSEPDSGSDLASIRTKAVEADGGWRVTGTKVWTSHAHHSHYVVVLCRTGAGSDEDRHHGFSQLIIDLAAPGVTVNPILLLDGEHHFNEVVFEEVFVPHEMVLGEIGAGWAQVTSELALERSGPERFLSTWPLVEAFAQSASGDAQSAHVGRLIAEAATLREMSLRVAAATGSAAPSGVFAALVKDLGTRFEGEVVDRVRESSGRTADAQSADELPRLLAQGILHSPGFTLRGGTSEILRGIVARELGLR